MPQIGRYPENVYRASYRNDEKHPKRRKYNTDEELLNAFKLNQLADKRMGYFIRRNTTKVSVSLAFFQSGCIILDEPTAGLDPVSTEILKEKSEKKKEKGKLILITSHILSELDDLVTHIIFMQDGNSVLEKQLPIYNPKQEKQNYPKLLQTLC